jgi:FAD-dependent halogenase
MTESFDAIVVGGGPGGSTAATFIAMKGHSVLLLEKEKFPVHKIGESLLPATVNGICAMLGVSDELRRANFVPKAGGTFRWGRSKEPWTVYFSSSARMPGQTAFAYQVERMKFDAILLENARRKGVDVREEHRVDEPMLDADGRVCGLVFRDASGQVRRATAKHVIDASGWTSTLARHAGERIYSKTFRNVAVYGYFRDGQRLPAPNQGNIFCAAFDQGWFWYIPLSQTLTSVGAVIDSAHAGMLTDGPEYVLRTLLPKCEHIDRMLHQADRVTDGPYGKVRVRKDFSYCHTQFWKPGLALVGDSACFIDPVFSSGVHLATYAGLLAARSVNSCLSGAMTEETAFTEFQRRYMREYRIFYDFLLAFYDMDQELDSYYWSARKVLQSNEKQNEAFIQLIAGIGGSGEPLFEDNDAFIAYQHDIARALHPVLASRRPTTSSPRPDDMAAFDFMVNLVTEAAQVQAQARGEYARIRPVPLFTDGLVPSADGFHWTTA